MKFTATNCHQEVANKCVEIASEVYELLCVEKEGNDFYKANPNMKAFVYRVLNEFGMEYVKLAREKLTYEMINPHTHHTRADKIHEILTKDAALRGPQDEKQNLYSPVVKAILS